MILGPNYASISRKGYKIRSIYMLLLKTNKKLHGLSIGTKVDDLG